jgi:hypothetical protein
VFRKRGEPGPRPQPQTRQAIAATMRMAIIEITTPGSIRIAYPPFSI